MSFNVFNPENGAAYTREGEKIEKPVEQVLSEAGVAGVPETPVVTETSVVVTEPVITEPVVVAAPPEINWEERTGGKYKTWEEINSKLAEQPAATPELTFANEQSKKIAEYIAAGKIDDVRQVLNDQARLSNLDKVSDADAIKLQMEFKNTQFDQNDITEEFSNKYIAERPEEPNENDYIDDDGFKAAQKVYDKELKTYEKEQKKLDRQLKIDAAIAREELRTFQSDIVLPDITPAQAANIQQAADQGPTEADIEAAKKFKALYNSNLEQSASDFKSIPFKLNDEGVNIEVGYTVDAAEVATMKKDLAEKNVIDDILLPRYIKGDDNNPVYDTKQLIEDIYWLNNKEKIVSNIVKQAIAQDRLLDLKDRKNVNLDNNQRGDFAPSKEAELKEFSKKFFQMG